MGLDKHCISEAIVGLVGFAIWVGVVALAGKAGLQVSLKKSFYQQKLPAARQETESLVLQGVVPGFCNQVFEVEVLVGITVAMALEMELQE